MGILQNLWDALGLGFPADDTGYDEEIDEVAIAEPEWQEEDNHGRSPSNSPSNSSSRNVIGLPGRGQSQSEVLLVEPRSFDEIPQVVKALKERKAVILNLSLMDADTAQRCVDFVAGGAFAIDGHQQRVGETIFLFTPSFVQISNYTPEKPESAQYPLATRPPESQPSIWAGSDVSLVQ